MKIFLVAVFLAAIIGKHYSQPIGGNGNLEDGIGNILTNLLVAILPDPIAVKAIDIKVPENGLVNGDINILEISLSGLSSLTIDSLNYDQDTSRLDFDINVADIVIFINTYIVLTGPIQLDRPISVYVDLKNLKIGGYAVIDEDKKSVSDLVIVINLEKSDIRIKGLLNDDQQNDELSIVLSEIVPRIVNQLAPTLSPVISQVIKNVINIILKLLL